MFVVANGFGYTSAIRTKRLLKMKPGAIGIAVAEKALQPPWLQRLRVPACCLLLGILSRLGGLVLYGAVALNCQIRRKDNNSKLGVLAVCKCG